MTFICLTNKQKETMKAEKRPQDKWSGLYGRSAGVFILLVTASLSWDCAIAQRLIDLTYTFDETTQVWPSNLPFHRDSLTYELRRLTIATTAYLWKIFSVGKPDMGSYRAARWS